MRRNVLLGVLLAATGCPEVEELTYRFDLRTGQGTLDANGIGTSDSSALLRDFATFVNGYLLGGRLQSDHPGWVIGSRDLYERDGRLDGRVTFTFASPLDAGLYQHDKKSGFLWCTDDGTTVLRTSGTIVPLYPNCVVFDRRAKAALVTVTTVTENDEFYSLLSTFRRWDRGPVGESAILSDLLANVEVPPIWQGLGFPLTGGTPVFATEDVFEVTHPGTSTAVLGRYTAVLAEAGFVKTEEATDRSVWTKETQVWYVSATQAGTNALVSVRRTPLE